MLKKLPVLFFSVLITGCASLNQNKFLVKYNNENSLLPLKVISQFDDPAFKKYEFMIQDFADNYIQPANTEQNQPIGEIEFRIIYAQQIAKDPALVAWVLPSLLSLCTLNMLGYPLVSQKSQANIQVNIFNKNKELVEGYLINSSARSHVALYWGYSMRNSIKASEFKALQKAFEQLAVFMNEDIPGINEKLK
ncbi:MAG: hypothetical protein JW723_07305 [Bacteroidales bacterium]|nr:hypothetical protein [Bacteroidales bacterium]